MIADAISKSAVLARDEREVAGVFEVMEPFAAHLAEKGRRPGNRRAILKHVGRALLVRQRVSGRVAVEEKPDVLWDRPDLERLYGRLEDEYELRERATGLHRKLEVIRRHRPGSDRSHRHRARPAARAHHRAADRVRDRDHVLPDADRGRGALSGDRSALPKPPAIMPRPPASRPRTPPRARPRPSPSAGAGTR